MKKMLFTLQLLLFAVIAQAQLLSPVKFTSQLKTNGTAVAEIVFSGKIQPGWHVYSTGLGSDGPISATFNVNKMEGVELVGKLQARGNEVSKYDNMFGMKLRFFENSLLLSMLSTHTWNTEPATTRAVCLLQRSTSSTQARRLP